MKNKILNYLLLVGLIFSNFSCNSYTKKLEQIIKQTQGTITFECKEEHEKEKQNKKVSLECSTFNLNISDKRSINILSYKPKKAFANIILLPTLGEPATSLDKFSLETASYGYNVYTLDVEGFGKSSGNRGKISIPEIEEDISTVIEYIKSNNDKKIVLTGTSIGSDFSLLYASEGKYRDLVDAVIAHGYFTPFSNISDFNIRVSFCRNKLTWGLIEFFTFRELNIFKILGKDNFYNNRNELEQIINDRDYVTKIDTKSYLKFLNYKPKNLINSYKGNIMFIISKDDKIIPFKHSIRVFDYFKKENSRAVLYIPEGIERNGEVPHMAFDTNYKEISQTINCFLVRVLQ